MELVLELSKYSVGTLPIKTPLKYSVIVKYSFFLSGRSIPCHISWPGFEPGPQRLQASADKELLASGNQQSAYAKTQAQISCAVTAQLISAYVFTI